MTGLIDTRSDVAVLAINFNSGDRILRVIRALAEQEQRFSRVLVVDNASEDGSDQKVQEVFPEVEILAMGQNAGLSKARNAGLEALDTPVVLMLDHDIYVQPGSVTAMLDAMRTSKSQVVCPRIRLQPEKNIVQADGATAHFVGTLGLCNAYRTLADTPATSGPVDGCIGACMLVARDEVLAAGGFEPMMFFYFEDLEFSLRMRALGHQIWCEAGAEVLHERGDGTPGLSFRGKGTYPEHRAYFSMRHRLLTIFLHYRWRTILLLAPALVLYELASLVSAIGMGKPRAWGKAWIWQVQNRREILRRRGWIQSRRVRGDRDLLSGGPLPLAPGFLTSRTQKSLAHGFSLLLDGYWRLARRFVA
ncbi:glycosyltransferase family 2 protein [Roseobacter ponti]|uniref:Glycosyltransferase family 2 protein n=1 Tax=Roseobacter ponti TaxID=1891787 RepID=A0A858SRI1_9RHOB|nr:glycosyltransferase family 2 protein [Roseobacter ponti]QJF50283.1 glycosyltransferase family 2 protein [Roseobacter ponti]